MPAARVFRRQRHSVAISVGRRPIPNRGIKILLVSVRQAIDIAVADKSTGDCFAMGRPHGERYLRPRHAPRILLAHPIEGPRPERRISREIRRRHHRARWRNRLLLDRAVGIDAHRVARVSSKIASNQPGITIGHTTVDTGIPIQWMRAASVFSHQVEAITVAIKSARLSERTEILDFIPVRHAVTIDIVRRRQIMRCRRRDFEQHQRDRILRPSPHITIRGQRLTAVGPMRKMMASENNWRHRRAVRVRNQEEIGTGHSLHRAPISVIHCILDQLHGRRR